VSPEPFFRFFEAPADGFFFNGATAAGTSAAPFRFFDAPAVGFFFGCGCFPVIFYCRMNKL
jgi:hypothetical protein